MVSFESKKGLGHIKIPLVWCQGMKVEKTDWSKQASAAVIWGIGTRRVFASATAITFTPLPEIWNCYEVLKAAVPSTKTKFVKLREKLFSLPIPKTSGVCIHLLISQLRWQSRWCKGIQPNELKWHKVLPKI